MEFDDLERDETRSRWTRRSARSSSSIAGSLLKRAGLGAAALARSGVGHREPGVRVRSPDALAADSFIKSHPKWKFVFVNHVTTNPFFVPTIYGAAGRVLAARLQLPVDGLEDVRRQPDGQRVQLGDLGEGVGHRVLPRRPEGVQRPDDSALKPRTSRCSPTTPTPRPNERLAYIGQDLYRVRVRDGPAHRQPRRVRATSRCSSPRPGQLNIQPRIDGATAAIKKFSGGKIKTTAIATGSQLNDEIAKIDAYYLGHKNLKGMFAVDAGSTQAVGQTVAEVRPAEEGREGRRLRPARRPR